MTSKHQFAGKYGRVKLSEIARIKAGNVAPKKDAFTKDGVSFVRAGSLAKLLAGESLDSLEKIDVRTARELRLTLFPKGTVVFAKSGMSCMTGNVYVLPDPCYVVSHLACVIPNGNYTAYLKHYFRFKRPNRLIENPSFPSIKLEKIRDIELCLPSSEVIDKQVQTLEHIEDQIKQMKAQLLHFEYLVKSRFVEMFGTASDKRCVFLPTEEVCEVVVDCPHETPKYQGDLKYPAIRTSELVGTTICWDTMKYVSEDEYQKRTRRLKPRPGDVVYAREGTYGNAAVLPKGKSFCLGQRIMLFRVDSTVCLPEFFLYALTSTDVRKQADELNVGTTVPHVNVRDAKKFLIPIPPLSLQREFADFVTQVDKLKFDFDFLVSFSIPSICLFCLKLDP